MAGVARHVPGARRKTGNFRRDRAPGRNAPHQKETILTRMRAFAIIT
ncbi:hypothetical protein [Nitrobacter sp.]